MLGDLHLERLALLGWGYVAPSNGCSRPSSMNSPPRLKYPRSTRYSSPRSSVRRAEGASNIPDLGSKLTTLTWRPSKSTSPLCLAACIASSYLIPVGLPSSVIRVSLATIGEGLARLFSDVA